MRNAKDKRTAGTFKAATKHTFCKTIRSGTLCCGIRSFLPSPVHIRRRLYIPDYVWLPVPFA